MTTYTLPPYSLDIWPFTWPLASTTIIFLSSWDIRTVLLCLFLNFLSCAINIYVQCNLTHIYKTPFLYLLTWLWRVCVLRVELKELVFIAVFVMGVDEFVWMVLFPRHFVFRGKGCLDMWWDQIHSLGSYPLTVLHSRDVKLTSNTQAFSQVSTYV